MYAGDLSQLRLGNLVLETLPPVVDRALTCLISQISILHLRPIDDLLESPCLLLLLSNLSSLLLDIVLVLHIALSDHV